MFRVCGLADVTCRMIRGVEVARRALTAAVRNIVGELANGRKVKLAGLEVCR